jgi:hypothetical protein
LAISRPSVAGSRREISDTEGWILVYDICILAFGRPLIMTEKIIKLRLNQQQLELMDRTIARGVAPDRVALVRLALHEYAATRKAEATSDASR